MLNKRTCNFPCGPVVKSPPSNAGVQVQSLGPHASRQLNPCTTIREACAPELLSPCAPEPANLSKESKHSNKDPVQPTNKQNPKNESLKVNTIIGFCERKERGKKRQREGERETERK